MSASHPMTDTAVTAIDDWRELASREGDGLEITLLWSKAADRVKVAVADSRLDEKFELHIADAEALAAFHHPVAYEAGRGIAFANPLRESFDLQTGELKRRDSCHREAFAAMVQFTPQGTYEEAVAYIDTIDRTATSPSIPAGS